MGRFDRRSDDASGETDAEIDELYGERPDRFVAVRNELAKAWRAAGRRDEAKALIALRRPTPASWALNQVARERPGELEALLDAGAALRATTERALAGRPADLRVAQDAQRGALDAVLDAAVGFGRRLGSGSVDQLRRRASGTLHAAIADDELRARLRAGRLDDDVDAPGFGFDGLAVPMATGAEANAKAARPRREAERTAARKATEREIDRRRREADRLERAAGAAEQAARDARRKADDAAAELARARAELRELDELEPGP